MNYTLDFMLNQFISWVAYAVGVFGLPAENLVGWYTEAYLTIGEAFPIGDLVFWILQLTS